MYVHLEGPSLGLRLMGLALLGLCLLTIPASAYADNFNCATSTDTGYVSGSPFEITVVHVDGKAVEVATANAYYVMQAAALADGIDLNIVSGFRTMASQTYLYNCYINCNCNNCNLAATPGYSNHQSGHALDLNTGGWNTARYNWLINNGATYGFSATVPSEHWHWEWWGGGPGGGICNVSPDITIDVQTSPPAGQAEDFRPEGSSSGIMDLYTGQTFNVDVFVRNQGNGETQKTDNLQIWVWFQGDYFEILDYTIYTDWPNFDLQTFQVSNADSDPNNPPKNAAPSSAAYYLEHFAAGEGKKISFTVKAKKYSIGVTDHPDVRAWVQHVGGWYGEQTGWNVQPAVNGAGVLLQDYKQHDIYSRRRWEFNGPGPGETEGWAAAAGATSAAQTAADPGVLSVQLTGADPQVRPIAVQFNADNYKAIEMRVRSTGGSQTTQVFFTTDTNTNFNQAKSVTTVSPGGGEWATVTVDFSGVGQWQGTITNLRVDPAGGATGGSYDIDYVRTVAGGTTSGDADGDGAYAPPLGADCDDTDPNVFPSATEKCNGADDNCNDEADEGFDVGAACDIGQGECAASGTKICSGDGTITVCTAAGADPAPETCNGLDDDCDGETDEELGLGDSCTIGQGACQITGITVCHDGTAICDGLTLTPTGETCNSIDDDCDGETDEDDVCVPCTAGETAACVLWFLPKECEAGERTCDDAGDWSECVQLAACPEPDAGPEAGPETPIDHGGSEDMGGAPDAAGGTDLGPDYVPGGGGTTPQGMTTAVKPTTTQSNVDPGAGGCSGGGSGGAPVPWTVLALIALIVLVPRRSGLN